MSRKRSFFSAGALALAVPVFFAVSRHETLGVPQDDLGQEIAIATGSDIVIGAVGIGGLTQPQNLEIEIPAGVAIRQVLAYWSGDTKAELAMTDTDSIKLDGQPVGGIRIGGPDFFFSDFPGNRFTGTYRADVTSLGLLAPGPNVVAIEGLDFAVNNGVSLVAIVQDGDKTSVLALRDGNDNAYYGFPAPRTEVIPQRFEFAAADKDRMATLSYLAASVEEDRPNVIQVTIDGVATPVRLLDELHSANGPDMDAFQHTVNVPAGATWLEATIFSEDGHVPTTGKKPASLNWHFGSLALPNPERQPGGEGCTPGFWKNHLCMWPDGFDPRTPLGRAFGFNRGTPAWDSGLAGESMLSALQGGGGSGLSGATAILMRAATAALLNAASPHVDYPLDVRELRIQVLLALNLDPRGSETRAALLALADRLDRMNNLGCDIKVEKCSGGKPRDSKKDGKYGCEKDRGHDKKRDHDKKNGHDKKRDSKHGKGGKSQGSNKRGRC